MDQGKIIRVESDIQVLTFGSFLLRTRIVTDGVKAERLMSSRQLVELSLIRPEDASRLQSSYVRSVLVRLMPEAIQTWSIDRTVPRPGTIPDQPIDPAPELMRAVAQQEVESLLLHLDRLRLTGGLTVAGNVLPLLQLARVHIGECQALDALRNGRPIDFEDAAQLEPLCAKVIFAMSVAGLLVVRGREEEVTEPPEPVPPDPEPVVEESAESSLIDHVSVVPAVAETDASHPVPTSNLAIEDELRVDYERFKRENHYEVLGVDVNARVSAIRLAWLRRGRQYGKARYEGVVGDEGMGIVDAIRQRLDVAARVLSDRESRLRYNRAIEISTPGLEARVVEIFEARALYDAGREFLRSRGPAEALAQFEAAQRQDPEEPEYFAAMARALLGMPPGAEVHRRIQSLLERALEVEPELIDAHIAMANLLRIQGRSDDSMEHVKRVLKIAPNHVEAKALRELLRRPTTDAGSQFHKSGESVAEKVMGLFRRRS
jgi:tetratricopeptide (TPR) repeat protein